MGRVMGREVLASIVVAAGAAATVGLYLLHGTILTVGMMYLVVLFAAYWGGRNVGLVATLLMLVLGIFVIPHEPSRMLLFAANSALMCIVIGRLFATLTAMKHSDDRFARVFSASPVPTLLVRETDSVFVAVNDAFLHAFGWKREEVIRQRALSLNLYPDASERAKLAAAWRADHHISNFELTGQRKDGELLTLLISVERVVINNVPHALMLMNDITDKRQSEERFRKVFLANPAPSSIVTIDSGICIAVNDAFLRLFGYTDTELVGKELQLVSNPDQRADLTQKLRDGQIVKDCELEFQTKTGERLYVLFSVERTEFASTDVALTVYKDITARKRADAALRESESRFRDLAENMSEVFWVTQPDHRVTYLSPAFEKVWGRSRHDAYSNPRMWADTIHADDKARMVDARSRATEDVQEYRIYRSDGSIRWIRDRGFPVRDDDGNVIRIVGLAEDITERRALEDQLRQTQKMESLGLLAGGVAHDFNNLLAVIASCSGILSEEMQKSSEHRELLDEITGAVDRASALTRQLLAFSRRQVTEPRVIDVNQIVNETRRMLRRIVGEDISLSTSLEPELGHVRADPGYLVQVLMNLAVNARDAMPRGGSIVITTRNVTITADEARLHSSVKTGAAVMLAVEDTGTGMSAEIKSRIFEPFFTTKGNGHGTGMGLAVVHGIVEKAGGFIDVESAPNVGSKFRVYLPCVNAKPETLADIAGAMAHGVEVVLLVDDDEHVRRTAARALRTRGYTVVEAANATAALASLDTREDIDLLLTDVVMPAVDGRQLAELARGRRPQLRVLYITGYTDDAVVQHGVMQGDVDLIEKPFRIDSLAAKVRQVLDRPTRAL